MLNFIKIGFLEIGVWDILDILLVALLMYQVYRLLRGSLAFNIFLGFLLFYLVYLIVGFLQMNLLYQILGQFIAVGFLAIFIVFQPEIRRFLLFIGRSSGFGERGFWQKLFARSVESNFTNTNLVNSILRAVKHLSDAKLGALLVFTQSKQEYFFSNTGVVLNADISSHLLESIFQKTSPLHDGAVVITEKEIYAAACVLPVSENPNLSGRLGMRHKAAVGISEQIDAYVLVISEETGKVSIAFKGVLQLDISYDKLQVIVQNALGKQ